MWGLLLSALTIGVSLVTKKEETSSPGQVSRSSRLNLLANRGLTHEDKLFFAGAVLGVGISLLYGAVTSYFRIHERLRLYWYSSVRSTTSDDEQDDIPWHESGRIRDAKKYLLQTADGSIQSIVTPETAATSSLNVSLLTLHPGREIPPTKSVGVEFYYVLEGTGRFSQKGNTHTAHIKAGDGFVVYPASFRWISNNNGSTDDLVLLRATDGGTQYSRRERQDVIRMDPNYKKKNPIERIRDSIQHLNVLTQDYLKRSSDNLANLRLKKY